VVRTEVQRKLIHLTTLLIPTFYFGLHDVMVTGTTVRLSQGFVALAFVWVVTLDFLRLRVGLVKGMFVVLFGSLLRRKEFGGLTGVSHLLLGSLLAALVYEPRVLLPAVAFLGLGDSMAAVVGLSIGRIRIWGKTLEGTLACLLSCLAVAGVSSILPYWNLPFGVGILGAVTATLAEVLPFKVNDNLAIPLMSGLVMEVALWTRLLGS